MGVKYGWHVCSALTMDYRKWIRSIHNSTSVGRCYKGLCVSRKLNQLEEHTSMPSKDSDNVLLDPNYILQYSNPSLTGVTAAPHAVSSHQICFIEDQDDECGIGWLSIQRFCIECAVSSQCNDCLVLCRFWQVTAAITVTGEQGANLEGEREGEGGGRGRNRNGAHILCFLIQCKLTLQDCEQNHTSELLHCALAPATGGWH